MKTYLIHLLVRFSKSHWRRDRLAPSNGLNSLHSSYISFHLKMKMDPVFQMLFTRNMKNRALFKIPMKFIALYHHEKYSELTRDDNLPITESRVTGVNM